MVCSSWSWRVSYSQSENYAVFDGGACHMACMGWKKFVSLLQKREYIASALGRAIRFLCKNIENNNEFNITIIFSKFFIINFIVKNYFFLFNAKCI